VAFCVSVHELAAGTVFAELGADAMSSPETATTPTADVPFAITAAGHTDVGRKRKNNEDCFALLALDGSPAVKLPQTPVAGLLAAAGVLLVVSDGMGGAEAGEVASRLAAETVVAELQDRSTTSVAMTVTLQAAVAAAHAAVFQAAESTPALRGMGCTLSVLWVRPGRAALAQVGDSRIYRWRSGTLEQLTRDQTVAQSMVARGEITEEQGRKARFHGMLEQVIGGIGDKPQPQVDEFDVAKGDRFLLCSDGCHDCLDAADFSARLGVASFDATACARATVTEARRRSGHDNITVIAAACGEDSHPSWRETVSRLLGRG
jgi:protein phosphatase